MSYVRQVEYVDFETPTGRARVALLTDGSIRVKMASPATVKAWHSKFTGNCTAVVMPQDDTSEEDAEIEPEDVGKRRVVIAPNT